MSNGRSGAIRTQRTRTRLEGNCWRRSPRNKRARRCDEILRNPERTRQHEDQKRAAARGVSAGFDIMMQGIRNGRGWIGAFHRWEDWTAGCIAVTDEDVEELWRVTPDGTTIEIRP